VLLLHGLLGEIEDWDAALEGLEPIARPMALQLPIFDPAVSEVTIPRMVEHIRAFMDALDLPAVVAGGNSLGGQVAIELALAHPRRVAGLILAGSSGLLARGFARGVPHRPTPTYVREQMETVFHDPARITPERVSRVHRLLTSRFAVLRVFRAARAARERPVGERLGEIRVPTLIVWGRDDRVTPPPVAERFHALIPGSELRLLRNCGHAPMLEQPGAFNAIVAAWLRRQLAPGRRDLAAARGPR
jgi:pimeloyl-ACP methyl ester carboxylesterase